MPLCRRALCFLSRPNSPIQGRTSHHVLIFMTGEGWRRKRVETSKNSSGHCHSLSTNIGPHTTNGFGGSLSTCLRQFHTFSLYYIYIYCILGGASWGDPCRIYFIIFHTLKSLGGSHRCPKHRADSGERPTFRRPPQTPSVLRGMRGGQGITGLHPIL